MECRAAHCHQIVFTNQRISCLWVAYASGTAPRPKLLGRGFTGHEHLPWFGLVNMNALDCRTYMADVALAAHSTSALGDNCFWSVSTSLGFSFISSYKFTPWLIYQIGNYASGTR